MKWLSNMRVSRKLTLLSAVGILFLLVVGMIGFMFTEKMLQSAEGLYEDRLLPVRWASEASLNFRVVERNTKELMLTSDKQEMTRLQQEIQTTIKRNDELLSMLREASDDANQLNLLAKIRERTDLYRPERAKAEELAVTGRDKEDYQHFQQYAKPHLDEINKLYTELNDYNAKLSEETLEALKKTKLTVNIVIVTSTLLSILIALLIGRIITGMITRPVDEMLSLMSRAEKGDLTVESKQRSKDEIGKLAVSFNEMMNGIRSAIGQVSDSAASLAASSQQISAGTEEIASGSQEQADSAGSAAEMMREMANAIRAVASNAEAAAQSAEEAVNLAKQGNGVIRDTVDGMNEISMKMEQLSSQSQKIDEIVEVIDEIAEQTNLLALNAAIEAARAGDAGKGFAVVADEVRKLAERSGQATKEIAALIGSMQDNTRLAVQAATAGNEKAANAGAAFQRIVAAVQASSEKVVEIAAASEEQNAQAEEVTRAVHHIAAVTEETSAGTQQTASTAQELARMAELLNELAAGFKVR